MSRRDSIDFYVVKQQDKKDEPPNSDNEDGDKNDVAQKREHSQPQQQPQSQSQSQSQQQCRDNALHAPEEIEANALTIQRTNQLIRSEPLRLKGILLSTESNQQSPAKRVDQYGNEIKRGGKKHKITFQEEIIVVNFQQEEYEHEEIYYSNEEIEMEDPEHSSEDDSEEESEEEPDPDQEVPNNNAYNQNQTQPGQNPNQMNGQPNSAAGKKRTGSHKVGCHCQIF